MLLPRAKVPLLTRDTRRTRGQGPSILNETDYVQWCGGGAPDWLKEGMVDAGDGTRVDAQVGTNH